VFGTSSIIHIVALLLLCWGAYEIISLKKEKKFLLKFAGGKSKPIFALLSPLSYLVFLARIFEVELEGKPVVCLQHKENIRIDRLFFLFSSGSVVSIAYNKSEESFVLSLQRRQDELCSEENLSRDLGAKIKISRKD